MVDFAKEFDARRTGAEDGEFVQELSGLVKACGAGDGVHVPAQRLAELMVEGQHAPEQCPHFSRRIQQVAVQCSDDDGALAVRALLNALGKTGTRGVGAIWALGRMLDDQTYRQGAVGRGLVLHAARALRQVAAVSCSAPSAGGPKCSRAGQAAAAGSRVLLLVRVCQACAAEPAAPTWVQDKGFGDGAGGCTTGMSWRMVDTDALLLAGLVSTEERVGQGECEVGTDVRATKPCSPGTRSGLGSGGTRVGLHNGLDNVGGRIDGAMLGELCSLALLTPSPPTLHAAGRVLAHHAARCGAGSLSKGMEHHEEEEDDVIGHVWHHLFLHHLVLASPPPHAHERRGASTTACSTAHILSPLVAMSKAEDTAEVGNAEDTAEMQALCKPEDSADVLVLILPRAVQCLRQMVQALLQPHVAQGPRRKRKAGELSGAVDALHAILQPTLDARQCAEKLARVVCSWMQTLPNVSKLLGMRQTTLHGGERAGHTVLAHLVYISVLWHLLPSASDLEATEASKQHEEEDKNVGDDLQAALLSAHQMMMMRWGQLMHKICVPAVISSPAPPVGSHDVALDVQDVVDICDLLRPAGAAISAENGGGGRMDAAVDRLAQVLVVARDHGLAPLTSPDTQDGKKANDLHALLRALPPRPLLRLLLEK